MKRQITARAVSLRRMFLGGILVLGILGCATSHTTTSEGFTAFLAYDGKQQNWPQAPSALAKLDLAVPVYYGLPSRSYQILGLVVDNEPLVGGEGLPSWLWTDETRLANACNLAKYHGADAVLLTKDPSILRSLNLDAGPASKSRRLLTNFDGTVVAIKWSARRF